VEHDAAPRRESSVSSLPPDVLEQSCRRVGILALVLTALWALGLALGNGIPHLAASGGAGRAALWPMPGSLITALGAALSAFLFVAARGRRHRPQTLLDVSLVFQVALAFLVGLLHFWSGSPPGGLSPLVLIILIFPMIAPNAAPKVLVASLLTASMDPVGFGMALLRGAAPAVAADMVGWSFVATYAVAFVAVIPAGIIRRLGRQVRQARDLGSYRLGDRIGSGGMGDVFHAEHRLLARPAAIKLIRPALLGAVGPDRARVVLDRFRREAQATAMLRSPHTIDLYDFGMADDGTFYFVMELLDGMGLDELVTRFGPLPPERAAHLVAQACDSLAEAHHRGMVHRDVKPSNLFATRNGLEFDFVKVLDFGLVKAPVERAVAGRAEMDPGAQEPVFAGHLEAAVSTTARQQERPRAVLAPVGGAHAMVVVVAVHAGHVLRLELLDAEPGRLAAQLVRPTGTRDPIREAGDVVQPLGGRRLSAQRRPLDHQRADPLARGVERRGEPGRPTARHDEIVVAACGFHPEAELGCQCRVGRRRERRTVREDDGRDDPLAAIGGEDERFRDGIFLDVHPAVRDLVLSKKLPAAAAVRAPVRAEDGNGRVRHARLQGSGWSEVLECRVEAGDRTRPNAERPPMADATDWPRRRS
jgi:serine/threonine-protein kinase